MKIPLSWLKEYVDVPVEPQKLGDDLTAAGLALEGLERDGRDVVLDFDITTNRVDCMNVYGVAREASVLYGLPLRPLALDFPEAGAPGAESLAVEIQAPDLCPRFCARVLDVQLGPSPQWLKDRLELMGERPISNVVDLTNYVMLEMGQPSHVFDLERIPQGRLVVRWARDGERVKTLDGQDRALDPRTGVVSGPEEPLGLAGIMGGASSEVSGATRRLALEAAHWEPLAIRRAARRLGMHTEASHRFERGSDYDGPPGAIARIAHLLVKIGAGTVRPGLIDVVARPIARRTLDLRPARAEALLGTSVPRPEAQRILRGLGFGIEGAEGERWRVAVPGWRNDVTREVDLAEELGRHRGLASIPNTLPPSISAGRLSDAQRTERGIRRTLADLGFQEAINYDFVPQADWEALPSGDGPVRLANPLSGEYAVLRTSLVPGLIRNLQTNLRQGRQDVALFEIGRVFWPGDAGARPHELPRLALLLSGPWEGRGRARARSADLHDLHGALENLAARLGFRELQLDAQKSLPWGAWVGPYLHPERWGAVLVGSEPIGFVAELHPRQVRALDLRERTLVAELDLARLVEARRQLPTVRVAPLDRFPAVERDLAVVWSKDRPARELVGAAGGAAGPLLRAARVVDVYEGPGVEPGRVSLTLRLRFQHAERTLTSDEVQASVDAVVGGLGKLGATLRGV
jgi:phenylalanyl-tRNA synthetase beta chain